VCSNYITVTFFSGVMVLPQNNCAFYVQICCLHLFALQCMTNKNCQLHGAVSFLRCWQFLSQNYSALPLAPIMN
jgi:hypothetical protein